MGDRSNFAGMFLDHSDIIGYIRDMESYDLLYMTGVAMKEYAIASDKDYREQKCYRVFHGLTAPCPFCPQEKLSFEHEYRWEHYNEKIDRWLDNSDRLITVDGRRCHLQVGRDITVRKQEDILSATGNITSEDVIFRALHILKQEKDISVALVRILKAISVYYQSDRACIFELDMERAAVGRSYVWQRPELERLGEAVPEFAAISPWLKKLEAGAVLSSRDVQRKVERGTALAGILEERDVQSLILAPLFTDGRLVGFLSVDNPRIKAENVMLLQNISSFIQEELQRRDLAEQLDFANTQRDMGRLLDFIRAKLDVDAAYVTETLAAGEGFLFSRMSVSDAQYDFTGREQRLQGKDFLGDASSYDAEGLYEYNLGAIDARYDAAVLHYGVFLSGICHGSIGVIDSRRPGRKWLGAERAMIRAAGLAVSGAIISTRLEKINRELEQTQRQLEQTAAALRQERQIYRDALVHDSDYAYLVNVTKNKVEDIYKGGFLERYGFSLDLPYDEAMRRVVERMQPVLLHGSPQFHLRSHYIDAYAKGRRMLEVEYYIPDTGAYKRKSLFLSQDESGTMHVFVVTHDITAQRMEELETEKSLTQLAAAAREVGSGNLDVEIDADAPGLVGVLADVLRQTILNLKWHIEKLRQQTTQDPMTGVKNKRAWQNAQARLEAALRDGTADFAVAVCDINGLKQLNDSIGHEAGDSLIIRASRLICNTFKHSPVYRIGGDEFSVILEGEDLRSCESLLAAFQSAMAAQPQGSAAEPPVSIALGLSRSTQEDTAFSDVFQRADEAMYRNKAAMKAGRE